MRETPKSALWSKQLFRWVRQGILPLDEILREDSPEERDVPKAEALDIGAQDLEDYRAVRRLKKYREISQNRERRQNETGPSMMP